MLWEKVSVFGITVTTPSALGGFPREGDDFIKQVILRVGYSTHDVKSINRVRVYMQVLFMSDILTASGHKVTPEILSPRPRDEMRSNMRWPNEHPDRFQWEHASSCAAFGPVNGYSLFRGVVANTVVFC